MAEELAAVPDLTARLHSVLAPAATGTTERVSRGKGEAPLPARLAALNLLGIGSDDVRSFFVPAIRQWSTVELAPADALDGPHRPVRRWHREPLYDDAGHPVMVLADDQVGPLPVRTWLQSWAVHWRTVLPPLYDRRTGRAMPPRASSASDDPGDPVADEWRRRWPETDWGPATRDNFAYLSARLDDMCGPHGVRCVADFAASLRALIGALRAALGDHDDLQYLGRCPEEIPDPDDSTVTRYCGARIQHDPWASVITCPRCHTETPRDRQVWLARRILAAWPLDRRRRYSAALITALPPIRCVTCGATVRIQWVDATEHRDRERFWRPGSVTCPAECAAVLP